jgi:hypothetical protein
MSAADSGLNGRTQLSLKRGRLAGAVAGGLVRPKWLETSRLVAKPASTPDLSVPPPRIHRGTSPEFRVPA